MCDIEQIMDMMNWNNTSDVQQKGVELARNIKDLDNFILPCSEKHDKDVWENCARVLSEKTDEELEPYLRKILIWLEDINWPGADTIISRLNAMHKIDILVIAISERVMELNKTKEYWLIGNLAMLLENDDRLLDNLPIDVLDMLKYYYWNC